MSSAVWRKKKEKKLATVLVGLFSLKEKAPTKNLKKRENDYCCFWIVECSSSILLKKWFSKQYNEVLSKSTDFESCLASDIKSQCQSGEWTKAPTENCQLLVNWKSPFNLIARRRILSLKDKIRLLAINWQRRERRTQRRRIRFTQLEKNLHPKFWSGFKTYEKRRKVAVCDLFEREGAEKSPTWYWEGKDS